MLHRIKLNIYLFYLLLILILIVEANKCFTVNNNDLVPQYELIKNSRSIKSVIVEKKLSLIECQKLAITRKALAFNFYKKNNKKLNCQLLECPEINSFSSLIRDNKFNYYSLYPRYLYPVNITVKCLPRVGVFIISEESKNYTDAKKTCEEVNGKLAHIISEERTEGLAKFITHNTPVFVGLSNRRSSKDRFWKNEFDEPLDCFDYRGWNKGEPSASRGCVGLIVTKSVISDKTPAWRVLPCSQSLPFICEILLRVKISKKDLLFQ
ncbi:GSCOCG00007334001-RA-CDS [Cotesia congregata]|nr:GSCOCG00007334001-RA-CDS [Cotesia congregata]